MIYIKKFDNNAAYTAYTASPDFITPNVSYIVETNGVAMTPYTIPETRVVAKFNVTDTSNPTQIVGVDWIEGVTTAFTAIEIDGVAQPSVASSYTFSTTGEHTVKYTLTDPTELGYCAFMSCSGLTSIEIPSSVTSIGQGAFFLCSGLTSVTNLENVASIGVGAFNNCSSLTSIEIPSGVTTILDSTFNNCISLTSVTIPNSVTSIDYNAFGGCESLESITIGNGVTSISYGAFGDYDNLQSFTIYATTPPELIGGFIEISNDAPIYVPAESVDAYKAADGWSDFEDRIQAI